MPIRQTWKSRVRGVFKIFNSSTPSLQVNKDKEFDPTSSAIYSDDSDECDSDVEVKIKKPRSIISTSSDISTANTIASKSLQECHECGKTRTINWCRTCESKEFVKHFTEWTSDNELLDKFIKNTQYKAYNHRYYWEWIPFEKFSNVKFLSNGGKSNVFTAIWLEGPRNQWDNENMTFVRRKMCKVILKRLVHTPDDVGPEFINELRRHYGHQGSRCSRTVQIYGMTLDPKSNCYMLVSAYHNRLDIRSLIQENPELSWSDKLRILHDCAEALLNIHSKGHVHKNLHPGNILLHSKGSNIFLNVSDLGLSSNGQEISGVIPYVAPEILSGWPYTQDSDVYSFSMLMFEFATGKPPFYDRAHDQYLIFDICDGLRPQFDANEIPKCFVELMNQCWDTEPVSRPCASEILYIIKSWSLEEFLEAEFEPEDFEIHLDAIYTSRPLGELMSRELELQDQFWQELSEAEESSDEQKNNDSNSDSQEEEEEIERVNDNDDNDDDNERMERMTNSENSEIDSENENDGSNFEKRIESKTNGFQLKLDLDFGDSLNISGTNEIENEFDVLTSMSNENNNNDDDDDDDDDENENDVDNENENENIKKENEDNNEIDNEINDNDNNEVENENYDDDDGDDGDVGEDHRINYDDDDLSESSQTSPDSTNSLNTSNTSVLEK